MIQGEAGDDRLYFEADGQVSDYALGQAGNDTFYLAANSGATLLYDFTPGGTEDVIVWQGSGFTDFAQLQASIRQFGSGIIITAPSGTAAAWLIGVTAAQLTAADFIFG